MGSLYQRKCKKTGNGRETCSSVCFKPVQLRIKKLSVNEMLQELQRNTLEERRKKDTLIMFYKIHNDQTGIDTGKYLKPLGRASRHVNNQAYEVPFAFTEYYKLSYFPRTIIEWNALPNETVNASSLTAFTNCL